MSPLSSVFNLYSYYKDYVRHFVIFSMTAAAVLMACSLRGEALEIAQAPLVYNVVLDPTVLTFL